MTILEKLQIKHPIFLSPMAGVTTPELAAAIANSGGLGALGLGACSLEQAKAQILATQKLTTQAFQLNFFCHQTAKMDRAVIDQWLKYLTPQFLKFGAQPPKSLDCLYQSFIDHDDFLNLALETSPKAVSFHFGVPRPHQIQALKAAGIMTMVTATNLNEALLIEKSGIDIIIAQGVEAGGHRGMFNPCHESGLLSHDLVQLLLKHCQIPVVAAGGIMTGEHAQRYLDLGASAIQCGTAFIACSESNAHHHYRQALLTKPAITQLTTTISGRLARGLVNAWHCQIDTDQRPMSPAYPYSYDLAKQLHAVASAHKSQEYAAFWAGTGVSDIQEGSAQAIFESILASMQGHHSRKPLH
jgi:nitronate monooxygenase